MPTPRAEVSEPQALETSEPLELGLEPGPRFRVEALATGARHPLEHGTAAKLHENRQRRHLPLHHRRPGAGEGEVELPVTDVEGVGREAEIGEGSDKLCREDPPPADLEPAEIGRFGGRQRERPCPVELRPQSFLVHLLGQPHRLRPIDDGKRHLDCRPVADHRLCHQQLVEIGVDSGADDGRVTLRACLTGEACHQRSPSRSIVTPALSIAAQHAASDPAWSIARQADSMTRTR